MSDADVCAFLLLMRLYPEGFLLFRAKQPTQAWRRYEKLG